MQFSQMVSLVFAAATRSGIKLRHRAGHSCFKICNTSKNKHYHMPCYGINACSEQFFKNHTRKRDSENTSVIYRKINVQSIRYHQHNIHSTNLFYRESSREYLNQYDIQLVDVQPFFSKRGLIT